VHPSSRSSKCRCRKSTPTATKSAGYRVLRDAPPQLGGEHYRRRRGCRFTGQDLHECRRMIRSQKPEPNAWLKATRDCQRKSVITDHAGFVAAVRKLQPMRSAQKFLLQKDSDALIAAADASQCFEVDSQERLPRPVSPLRWCQALVSLIFSLLSLDGPRCFHLAVNARRLSEDR